MHLDEVDKKIVNELISNSRLSAREIASKIQIAPVTVINRMTKLEKEGIIKGYSAVIDSDIIYDFQIIIHFNDENQIIEFLKSHKNITDLLKTTGEKPIAAVGKFKTKKELNLFLEEASKITKAYSTEFIMQTIKEKEMIL
jgi:DNA-binding Lrp family transcriptional regulator